MPPVSVAATPSPANSSAAVMATADPVTTAAATATNSMPTSATAIAKEDTLTRRLSATTLWLNAQPLTTVSIQLLGAAGDVQVKTDIERLSQQIELDNIYVYRTKVNGLPFLTVLYGSFANRFEATQALQKLPAEIQKNHPQLRTIAGVLQEAK